MNEDEIAERAHEHAWEWFALHATQRMQAFNYFLVGTAFLFAAYGTLLDKYRPAALQHSSLLLPFTLAGS